MYKIRNASFDLQPVVEMFPVPEEFIENSYWKMTIQVFSHPGKKELVCVQGAGNTLIYNAK